LKEFEDNELAADAKYKDETLTITGIVNKIDTELFDDEKYILRLGGGGDFEFLTVNCYDMSTDELSTLAKCDAVTVIGEFDDGGDLGVEVKELPTGLIQTPASGSPSREEALGVDRSGRVSTQPARAATRSST
jgi:hypothetical protein